MADLSVSNHGSICILYALTEAGTSWCDEYLPDDVMMWGSTGYVVEPRYVEDIVCGAEMDGLEVSGGLLQV